MILIKACVNPTIVEKIIQNLLLFWVINFSRTFKNLLTKVEQVVQGRNKHDRRSARVVKGFDSKSNGFSRAGSNPADVVLFEF